MERRFAGKSQSPHRRSSAISTGRQWKSSMPQSSTGPSQEGRSSSLQQSGVGPIHGILDIGSDSPTADSADDAAPSKRARKERGPNWNPLEIKALVEAKRLFFLQELDSRDGRDLMTPDAGKWRKISLEVMRAGVSPCFRDGPSCKSKWNQMIPDYKRISDFLARTGCNDETEYWTMSTSQRKIEHLPRSFPQDVFFLIHDWYGVRPTIMPPHDRDALAGDDCNYRTPGTTAEDADDSDNLDDDPIPLHADVDGTEDLATSTLPRMAAVGKAKARTCLDLPQSLPPMSPCTAPKGCIPAGVTTQLLSSTDTGGSDIHRRPPNTGVRRKSISGHSLIAEATRATSDAMSTQMKEMAEASRELEKSKIDVQMQCFSKRMEYHRDRDLRLQENARQANENAKLAIDKQGDVVRCLAELSTVLRAGLQRCPPSTEPHTATAPLNVTPTSSTEHVRPSDSEPV